MGHNHITWLDDLDEFKLPTSYQKRLKEEKNKPQMIERKKQYEAWEKAYDEWYETHPVGESGIDEYKERETYLRKRIGEILNASIK